jgi:hypothetical protein
VILLAHHEAGAWWVWLPLIPMAWAWLHAAITTHDHDNRGDK